MATRQSVEAIIAKTEEVILRAKEQLDQTNRNGYEITTIYDQAQAQLSNLDDEINKLMDSANHQQREQLYRLHLQVSRYLNDMILDANQLYD